MGSLFEGAGKSTGKKNANYIRPGHFLMRINQCKTDENRKKEPFAAVEGTVICILDSDTEHRLGEDVTFLIKKASDYFEDEMVSFLGAATGMDVKSETDENKEQALAAIFESDNPLSGTVLEVFAKNIVLKESGRDFTQITWRGEVEPHRLKDILSDEELDRFYPGGALDDIIAETSA